MGGGQTYAMKGRGLLRPKSGPAYEVYVYLFQLGVKSRTKSKSLFEDEDLLFGASEESPNVDLFSKSTPPTPQASLIWCFWFILFVY